MVTTFETIATPGKVVSHRLAPVVVEMSNLRMVSKRVPIGHHLVAIITTVGSLHHPVPNQVGVITLQVQGQVLLVQTLVGDALHQNHSKARMVIDMQDLLEELLFEDIQNLLTRGGNPSRKTTVVVSPLIILLVPQPNVCVVVEHIRIAIVEDILFGKAPRASSVALCMIHGCIKHAAPLHRRLLNLDIVKSRIIIRK